jgi:hypothetical protein
MEETSKAFELDSYGITTLKDFPFNQYTEEISLFDNLIENPNEVA